MTQTILLAGATGMLGSRIAAHLLDQPEARLRLLVRSTADAKLKPLLDRGAEVLEGDLANRASLDRATQGVDVIVSAIQGGPEIVIDGQVMLAEAGKRNGVRRILPSDFGLDLFKATPGEHAAFNMRVQADAGIAAVGLEQVNILQGAFMDLFLPGMQYMRDQFSGRAKLQALDNERYPGLIWTSLHDMLAHRGVHQHDA